MNHDRASIQTRIDPICDEFERAWKNTEVPPVLSDFIVRVDAEDQPILAYELILLDQHYRMRINAELSRERYLELLPTFTKEVERALERGDPLATVASQQSPMDATIADSAPRSRSIQPGEAIRYFGDYEIIDEIARGGMGVVYRAKQISLNRIIALKMILSGRLAGEDDVRRFQMEAEAAANLDHPCIVPIYDIGEYEGQHYFSMKLIEGKTLSQAEKELKATPQSAVELVASIADAMHHAHQRGILHRDLKPANILIEKDGRPMITDFGLARDTQRDSGITQTGAVVGTPGYMSPEQASGGVVTTAADIYSLGAILYRLLCGRAPHEKDSVMDTLLSAIHDDPPRPASLNPNIGSDLELVLQKCLARNPAKRYASASELASDLRTNLAGEPVSVRAPSALEVARLWIRKNYGNAVWIPMVAIICGVFTGFFMWAGTYGQDMSGSLSTYENFPAMDRPWLAQRWDSLNYLILPLVIIPLVMIGWLTVKLVETKNRAADIGAGLSVGILAGLIAFASGMGAVMLDTMRTADKADSDLLMQLAVVGDKSYTQERIVTRYPTLEKFNGTERAWLLDRKRQSDQWATSVVGIALGSFVCILFWGVSGLVLSWIAGPLVRERSFWRALVSYLCFALAFGFTVYSFGGELSLWMILGASGGFEWILPVIAACFALVTMVAVWRKWSLPAQIGTALVSSLLFVTTVYVSYNDTAPPLVAHCRAEIKKAKRLVDQSKDRRDYALRLTRAHQSFAGLLRNLNRDKLALEAYEDSIKAIEAGAVTEEFEYEERVLYSQLLFEGAKLAMELGDLNRAADWSSEHTRLYYSSMPLMRLYGKSVLGLDEPVEPYVRTGGDPTKHPVWWTAAAQIRELAMQKNASEVWVSKMIDQVISRKKLEDPAAPWIAHEERLRRWLLGKQNWDVFGPFPLPKGKNELNAIDDDFEPESSLLAGQDLAADSYFDCYTGAYVDLSQEIGDKQNVVIYLKTDFKLDEALPVHFKFGVDDAVKIWIDGALVHRNDQFVGIFQANDQFVASDLSKGKHTLVMKITQGSGEWGFTLDAADEHNGPLPIWDDVDVTQ